MENKELLEATAKTVFEQLNDSPVPVDPDVADYIGVQALSPDIAEDDDLLTINDNGEVIYDRED